MERFRDHRALVVEAWYGRWPSVLVKYSSVPVDVASPEVNHVSTVSTTLTVWMHTTRIVF